MSRFPAVLALGVLACATSPEPPRVSAPLPAAQPAATPVAPAPPVAEAPSVPPPAPDPTHAQGAARVVGMTTDPVLRQRLARRGLDVVNVASPRSVRTAGHPRGRPAPDDGVAEFTPKLSPGSPPGRRRCRPRRRSADRSLEAAPARASGRPERRTALRADSARPPPNRPALISRRAPPLPRRSRPARARGWRSGRSARLSSCPVSGD